MPVAWKQLRGSALAVINQSGKKQLASLTNAEIISLIRALPGLAISWARSAGTEADWLERGKPRALATLRVAMARRGDELLISLAHLGIQHIADASGPSGFKQEAADRPRELAVAAGNEFGSAAGSLFLSAVAASDDPLAVEVAARLTQLQDLAAQRGSRPEELESAHGRDAVPPPLVLAGDSALDVPALLERTQELLDLGAELAPALRAAAASVESGRPVTEIGDRLQEWSDAVQIHLTRATGIVDAANLAALSEGLAAIVSRAQAEEQRYEDVLRGARLLREQGLDHLVPGLLEAAGFDSPKGPLPLAHAYGADPNADQGPDASIPGELTGEADASPDLVAARTSTVKPGSAESSPPAELPDAGVLDVDVPDAGVPDVDSGEPPEPNLGATDRAPTIGAHPVSPEDNPVLDVSTDGISGFRDRSRAPAEISQGGIEAADGGVTEPDSPLRTHAQDEPGCAPLADDESIAFPWDLGSPPLLALLISEGRDALAVCIAEAAEETASRQRLLRFFCAAYACSPTGLEPQLPELTPPDDQVQQMGADECRVLIAAALRAGLALGYSPVGLAPLIDRADFGADGTRAVIEAAVEAVRHGYHRRGHGTNTEDHADLLSRWAAFEGEARQLRESLARRTIKLRRASDVLHHLTRQDQPVGRALDVVAELASRSVSAAAAEGGTEKEWWNHIEKVALALSSPAKRAKVIVQADRAVSTGSQLRKPIIAGARNRLDESLQEVAELLARFVAVRSAVRLSSNAADLETAEELLRAISLRTAGTAIRSVGDAAVERLVDWLRADTTTLGAASIRDLLRSEIEPLFEIPRDRDGNTTRPPSLAEASELVRGRDLITILRGYLRVGNLAAARSIIAASDQASSSALDDEVLRAARRAERRHEGALAAVDRTAARLRAVYEDEAARDLTVHTEPLRVPPVGRFDLTIEPLHALAKEGAARLRAFGEDLRERTESSRCTDADKRRILGLIDQEDEILAVEFLTLADAGRQLPVVNEPHGDDFSDFFPAMVNAAVTASLAGNDAIDAVRAAAGATAGPANRQLAAGLEAWRELQRSKRAYNDRFRLCVADVLRMLGIVPRPQSWLQELTKTQRAGYATFKVRAAPLDRSYVPSLGTQAHDAYDLTIVWDSVTPTRLMDFIEERRRTEANIILYFGVLDPDQRLTLRRLTSHEVGKGFSPVVVNQPVIGWLSTRPEPGWRFTQRVTLPFTTLNPYTPFAGGEVPDEVFVGRESERQAIESPTGSMFVYGGRQLGKSALLRRVERLFTEPMTPRETAAWAPRAGHVAVYLDLKAASIGEAQEPAALWAVLAQRLKDAHVLSPKTSRGVGPDEVTNQLSRWLNADDANRLLLLLDEADSFLTADFRAGLPGGGGEFPTLQRLKGLMEVTARRFKPVFARPASGAAFSRHVQHSGRARRRGHPDRPAAQPGCVPARR